MPIVIDIKIPKGRIALWKIEESLSSLEAMCKPEEVEYTKGLSAKRAAESLAWRALLHAIEPLAQTSYDSVGAPLISGSEFCNIGVSHGGGCAAIILGNEPCAVDVEDYNRDFSRAASRFVSKLEMGLKAEAIPLIWCAKECMYKWRRAEGVDMLTQMTVNSIDHITQKMEGTILESKVNLSYIRYENIYMVFCI